KTLWQVGEADGRNAEFALTSKGYEGFSDDGFYVVGRSDSRQEWPFIQPGPADGWAGSRPHSSQVVFGLKKVPDSASRLVVRVLDTQGSIPPRLRVTVNKYTQEIQLPRGGGDDSLSGNFSKSKPYVWNVPVPASALLAGQNRVSITSVGGSWLLFDAVSFEADPATELAPSDPVIVESVEARPVLNRDKTGALVQPVVARVRNFGPATSAMLKLNGQTQNVAIRPGASQVSFTSPETEKEVKTRLTVEVEGKQLADTPVTLSPVRHWTIYLIPHSHVDIGYTQQQEEVRLKQIANMQEALDLIKRTSNYPAGSQFKWNLEVLWPMEEYLRTCSPAQRQEMLGAIRSGKLVVNAYFGNLLTGLCSAEELLRASAPSLGVVKQAGITLD
ncbi:MAG: hypothetical protein EOP02_31970, partial [Proteobacteria bacterium]